MAPKKAAKKRAPATSTKKPAAKKAAPRKTAAKKAAKPARRAQPARAKKTANKPAPKRVVPKRSALRGTSIDAYLERLPEWQRAIAARLHEIVHAASPHVTSSIKWAQPVFEHNGPFAYIKPATAHVTFGFWRGADLDDPAGLLDGGGGRMKHMKLAAPHEIDADAIAAMVADAVRLNAEKGNPTKR
ncbi:MAG TPA: DUF1801 domain-containing protein [Minicystis sp.]|nr:DUF1801 domain-containing protein [Minicystis sp.]